jgi:hypothetical protein
VVFTAAAGVEPEWGVAVRVAGCDATVDVPAFAATGWVVAAWLVFTEGCGTGFCVVLVVELCAAHQPLAASQTAADSIRTHLPDL